MSVVSVTPKGAMVLAAVAGVGLVLAARKAGAIGNALNPLNHDNAIAQGVNTLGATLFTQPDDPGKNADGSWSLGGWFYDVLNPGTAQAVKDMSGPVAAAPAPVTAPATGQDASYMATGLPF